MESLRLKAIRFHQWMTTSVPIPRSVCVFASLFVMLMFVVTLAVGSMARAMPKPVQVCPGGEPIYKVKYL